MLVRPHQARWLEGRLRLSLFCEQVRNKCCETGQGSRLDLSSEQTATFARLSMELTSESSVPRHFLKHIWDAGPGLASHLRRPRLVQLPRPHSEYRRSRLSPTASKLMSTVPLWPWTFPPSLTFYLYTPYQCMAAGVYPILAVTSQPDSAIAFHSCNHSWLIPLFCL